MLNHTIRKSVFFKAFSFFLIFAFSVQNIGFAVSDVSENENKIDVPLVSDAGRPGSAIGNTEIGVALDIGSIKSTYNGANGKTIIHIQDAHCNYEAQNNINKILEQLTKECDISLISVEGAEGIVDTTWFRAFPDAEIRKEVATYFMKKGEITGAEFFSINSDYEGVIFGAETRDYYVKNLKAFTEVYPYKEEMEKYFRGMLPIVSRLKSLIYTPPLKDLDSKISEFDKKELELSGFSAYLAKKSSQYAIDIKDCKNFGQLISTLEYEGKINFDIVDQERSRYIDALSKKLSKQEMSELVAQSVKFKKGHIKPVDFYTLLRDLAKTHNIPIVQDYPNLFYYYIYTKLYDGIDNETLFKEIDSIKTRLKEKLFATSDQRKLARCAEMLDMFVNLINIELTNEDYDLFKEYKKELSLEDVVSFVESLSSRYNLNYSIGTVPAHISENIPSMIDFYEIAMERDKVLISNTLSQMKKEKKDKGILIAGGFHTRGIKNLLEKQGISYVIVTPKITKDVETPYIKVLTNQRTSFEDIINESVGIPDTGRPMLNEKPASPPEKLLSQIPRVFSAQGLFDEKGVKEIKELSAEIGTATGESEDTLIKRIEAIIEESQEKGIEIWLRDKKITPGEEGKNADEYLKEVYTQLEKSKPDTTDKKILKKWQETIKGIFNKFKPVIIEKFKVRKSPGEGAMALKPGAPLSTSEFELYDEVLRQSFRDKEPEKEEINGLIFWIHDNFEERIALENDKRLGEGKQPIPYPRAHPGTWRGAKNQVHISAHIWHELSPEEKETLANHEWAHLDIYNLGIGRRTFGSARAEKTYALWQEYLIYCRDNKIPVDQENFIDSIRAWAVNLGKSIEEKFKKEKQMEIKIDIDDFADCDTSQIREKMADLQRQRILDNAVCALGQSYTSLFRIDLIHALGQRDETKLRIALTEAYILAAEYNFTAALNEIINLFELAERKNAKNNRLGDLCKTVFLQVASWYPQLYTKKDITRGVNYKSAQRIDAWLKELSNMPSAPDKIEPQVFLMNEVSRMRKISAGGSIPAMAEFLMQDTLFGDAAKTEIERLRKENAAQPVIERFVKDTFMRRYNIDRMQSILTDEEYKGYDVIIVTSSTPDEAEYQQKALEQAFRGKSTQNEDLNKKVCILSVIDESEGGQIIGGEVNTWRRAVEMFEEWAISNSVSEGNLDILYKENKIKIAVYQNGGKGERASPATQALGNSRGAQKIIGHIENLKGENIPVTLIVAIVLDTAPFAITNDSSRIDFYWGNQRAFGTIDFTQVKRTNCHFDKFVIKMPEKPKNKDLFDYGTAILSKDGRIEKFLANQVLTKKNEAGLYEPNPGYAAELAELKNAPKSVFDYGSYSISREMHYALINYWTEARKILEEIDASFDKKSKISRDIDNAFVQILVPLVNGLKEKELPLSLLDTSELKLMSLTDKEKYLDGVYKKLIRLIDKSYVAALEKIYSNEGKKPWVRETVEFFLLNNRTLFQDLDKVTGHIDMGEGSHWFAYKRLLDLGNEKFFMLSDIAGFTQEIMPDASVKKELVGIEDRIKAEDARRARRIPYNAVVRFTTVSGREITLTAREVKEGWKDKEGLDIFIKGSVIWGDTMLLPGSKVVNSVINDSQGRIIAENSYIESSVAPFINVKNSIILKGIDNEEILLEGEIIADAFRPEIQDERFPEGQTRMRGPIGYDPKGKNINDKTIVSGNEFTFQEIRDFKCERFKNDAIEDRIRNDVLSRIKERLERYAYCEKTFKKAKMGTSGLRALAEELTDMEVNIVMKGVIEYLIDLPNRRDISEKLSDFIKKGAIKRGDYVPVAGDLRDSTDRIIEATALAVLESGNKVDYIGKVPTPVAALYGLVYNMAIAMVTGSHIPKHENGEKFYRANGELWKEEEPALFRYVEKARKEEYLKTWAESKYNKEGMLKKEEELAPEQLEIVKRAKQSVSKEMINKRALEAGQKTPYELYEERFLKAFGRPLKGIKAVFWEQTAVGRDFLPGMLSRMGADIINDGRVNEREKMVTLDTEDVKDEYIADAQELMNKHDRNIVITTDGDSDRPAVFVRLKNGEVVFIPGDKLNVLAALLLRPKRFSIPETANYIAMRVLEDEGIETDYNNVGSPYIDLSMMEYLGFDTNDSAGAYGCEVNGGGFIGDKEFGLPRNVVDKLAEFNREAKTPYLEFTGKLTRLSTRDAMMPIISSLLLAKIKGKTLPELYEETFSGKYQAETHGVLVENVPEKSPTPGCENYTKENGHAIVETFMPKDKTIRKVYVKEEALLAIHMASANPIILTNPQEIQEIHGIISRLEKYLTQLPKLKNERIEQVIFRDKRGSCVGVHCYLSNNERVILRPSGNAVQFRGYVLAKTIERAKEIGAELEKPNTGILVQLIQDYIKNKNFAEVKEESVMGITEPRRLTPGMYAAAPAGAKKGDFGEVVDVAVLAAKDLKSGERRLSFDTVLNQLKALLPSSREWRDRVIRFTRIVMQSGKAEEIYNATSEELVLALRLVQYAALIGNLEPTDFYLTRYPWAGDGNRVQYNLSVPGQNEFDVSEIWNGITIKSKRNPEADSVISGTAIIGKDGKVIVPDITLRELVNIAPELFLGKGHKNMPFFIKSLSTRFADKVYEGFNKGILKIGKERYTAWLLLEMTNMNELLRLLRPDLTKAEFEEYRAIYEKWAIKQADNEWKLDSIDRKIAELAVKIRKYFVHGVNSFDVLNEIARQRADIVSVLNEIELKDGMIVLSPTGTPHGIFGLSLQVHPIKVQQNDKGEMEYPKNEAWIVKSVFEETGKERELPKILIEPQQTSDTTFSVADFFTPIVWDSKQAKPKIRKDDVTEESLKYYIETSMVFKVTPLNEIILQPVNITPSQGVRNAKLMSLINETSSVWPTKYFIAETAILEGKGPEDKASIVMPEIQGHMHNLMVLEGTVTIKRESRKETVLTTGMFLPMDAQEGKYTIESEGKAEVLRVYPEEESYVETAEIQTEDKITREDFTQYTLEETQEEEERKEVNIPLEQDVSHITRGVVGDKTGMSQEIEILEFNKEANVPLIIGNRDYILSAVMGDFSVWYGNKKVTDVKEGMVVTINNDMVVDLYGKPFVFFAQSAVEYSLKKESLGPVKVKISYDNTIEEKDVYTSWQALTEFRGQIAQNQYTFIAPKAMYEKGAGPGSKDWEKDKLNECLYSRDTFDIVSYNAETGLVDKQGHIDREIETAIVNAKKAGRISLLVATQELFSAASKNKEFLDFLKAKEVRIVPPIPDLNALGDKGWFFTREVEANAMLQGILTVKSIEAQDNLAQKVRKVISQSIRRDFDINELYYLVAFGDETIPVEYKPANTLDWMMYMIQSMLQRMPVKPYNAFQDLENQRQTMYSV